jgi:hypothetical protein
VASTVEGLVTKPISDEKEIAKAIREPRQEELALQHAKQTGVHIFTFLFFTPFKYIHFMI